jgi:2-C-methyl-D-erythritol 4-phosphate cytidylyltransferase
MKKYAVIVAGGSGTRMNSQVPKQFLLLKGKNILQRSVDTFLSAFDDMNVVVVLPHEFLLYESIQFLRNNTRIRFTEGGATRFHSVQNGLKMVPENAVVFVHDAVRCLVTTNLIHRCYEQAIEKGSAVPAVPVKDSIRILENNGSKPLDRNKIRVIQTPQTFKSDYLLAAYQQTYQDSFTDEATVLEKFGMLVHLIEGEETNIKITVPNDLLIAEKILEEREPS